MRVNEKTRWLVLLAGLAMGLCACSRPSAPERVAAVAAQAAAAAPKPPVDHLAPGELPEGKDELFGLVLPRGMTIEGHFADNGYAAGPHPEKELLAYVKAHVREATVKRGVVGTTFEKARVPSRPERTLMVTVSARRDGSGSSLWVRDVTPLPAVNLPNEEARWRAVGVAPDGRQIGLDQAK